MAGLCWMAVMVAFFLSAENSLAVVDQNRLASFVSGILGEYGIHGMFSLAVSIPDKQNQNISEILQTVFQRDPGNNVKNTINKGKVYNSTRVVAAKVLYHSNGRAHAESRVVDSLDRLFSTSTKNDLLLFYVSDSPCVEKCSNDAHRASILTRIKIICNWTDHAFVFTKIYEPQNGYNNTDEQRRGALERLGSSIGLENIFRCDENDDRRLQCTSCSNGGNVTNYCFSLPSPSTSDGRGLSQSGRW